MECTLKELVAKLSELLVDHPDATVCSFDDCLAVEDVVLTKNGSAEEVFKITSDAHKLYNGRDCLKVEAR